MHKISHVKYKMEDMECKYCTEYNRKKSCKQRGCPWLAERMEAGAVDYEDAVMESFSRDPSLEHKLLIVIRLFQGSMWMDEGHHQRMEAMKVREGFRRKRDTPPYFAAMYLLTANRDICNRTANCFCRDGIVFDRAAVKDISPRNYTLLSAARDIYTTGDRIALADLADREITDTTVFCLIVNALLIARYGSAALELRQKTKPEE